MGRHARPTRGVLAVHEKQEANRMATASHEELPRLPSRDGKYQQKEKGVGEYKLEGRKDPWVPRDWDTRTHLKKKEHYTTTTPVNLDKWLVDSAATSHFCMEREWYDSKELPPSDALIRSKDWIKMERTAVYTPEQNGESERFTRTVIEGIREMLQNSGVCAKFWAAALQTFVHIRNRC
ncbi:hypothetical protein AVEN_158960-2 [Araneus ventricosus]|uniref:Integrase catalytic domain-containing protein n=1 Tax=Araneus ventricosus TaxID=182803 RepID=A0A4Y2BBL8_ARAVE|nr:hypothetical protein AVEN_158960-2 [Araneus ventricosus]